MNNKFWLDRNVLITGHTGFKGTWLSLWLNKLGSNVSGLSLKEPVSTPDMFMSLGVNQLINNNRGDIIHYDICSDVINNTRPQIIFHMAAQALVRESYNNPIDTYKTNIIGTANILEAARNCETVKTIVVITTDKCYENVEKDYAYVETDPLGGYDPYSSSKACAEHVASAYYRSFFKEKDIGLATVRAGNVIGGGDWSADRLIPDAVKTWSENKKLIIRYPEAIRPWQHVLEPLSGYLMLAKVLLENPTDFSGGWNFGPNQNSVKTVQDVVELAANNWSVNAEWEPSHENHIHEASLLQLNSSKAKSQLGWKPLTDFEKGVSETIRWYKEYYRNNVDMKAVTLQQIEKYENNFIHA